MTEKQHNSSDGGDKELGLRHLSSEGATSFQDEEPQWNIFRPDRVLNVGEPSDIHLQQRTSINAVLERFGSAGTRTTTEVGMLKNDSPDIPSQSRTSTHAVVGRFGSVGTTTKVVVDEIQSSTNMEHINFSGPSGNSRSHSSDSTSGDQKPTSRSAASNDARRRILSQVFTCDFCPIVFDSHEHMCTHTKEVHFGCTLESSDRIFLICICGRVYFNKKTLREHSEGKHLAEECDGCEERQKIKRYVDCHQFKHFQMYRYQCSRCLDRFKTKEDFESKKKHKCDCIRIPAWRLPTVTETVGSIVKLGLLMNASRLRSRRYSCGVKLCTSITPMEVPNFRNHCKEKHNLLFFEYQCRCDVRFDEETNLIWHQQTCDQVFRLAISIFAKSNVCCRLIYCRTENIKLPLAGSSHNCDQNARDHQHKVSSERPSTDSSTKTIRDMNYDPLSKMAEMCTSILKTNSSAQFKSHWKLQI